MIRLQKLKEVKKQRSVEKRHKVIESRKSLTNVRVVQKNLVFVIGLSPRLADPEVSKHVFINYAIINKRAFGDLLNASDGITV